MHLCPRRWAGVANTNLFIMAVFESRQCDVFILHLLRRIVVYCCCKYTWNISNNLGNELDPQARTVVQMTTASCMVCDRKHMCWTPEWDPVVIDLITYMAFWSWKTSYTSANNGRKPVQQEIRKKRRNFLRVYSLITPPHRRQALMSLIVFSKHHYFAIIPLTLIPCKHIRCVHCNFFLSWNNYWADRSLESAFKVSFLCLSKKIQDPHVVILNWRPVMVVYRKPLPTKNCWYYWFLLHTMMLVFVDLKMSHFRFPLPSWQFVPIAVLDFQK